MAIVPGVVPISISKAKELMQDERTYIFDANEDKTRQAYGYIKGAIHINADEFEEFLSGKNKLENLLPTNKNATIVVYCLNRLCNRSSLVAKNMMDIGYQNVYVMIEGIEKWIILGNQTQKLDAKTINQINEQRHKWLSASNSEYKDGVHSNMLLSEIPSCRDCHGVGKEIKSIDANLALDHTNLNSNCVSCHQKVANALDSSIHSVKNNPKDNIPLCSDCHKIHITKNVSYMNIAKLSDQKCGSCHEKEQSKFHQTFHGKVVLLDNANHPTSAASCSDCHGSHKILPPNKDGSKLYGERKVQTCASCHEGANENFASFIAHADHTDKEGFPGLYYTFVFMTGLIIAVFGFFGLHTLLWSIKLIQTRLKYPKQWQEALNAQHQDNVKIKRFSSLHKVQHIFLALSFLVLTFSGIPQKFHDASWAEAMIDMMGGPIMATKIHHVAAVVMIVVFLSNVLEICFNAYKKRDAIKDGQTGKMKFGKFLDKLFGPDSLFPRKQDFIDIKNHFLWFFGKGERPQFDRWTYWEKFDYLAVFWGMFIIGLSGLALWFPVFFTKFMPGWMLNICYFIHSDEALLATGFIFAIHFFNTHFRANKFPMDMVIFSGSLSEEELKQERKPWYDRLVKTGKLQSLKTNDSKFAKFSLVAKILGFAMLAVGMLFLLLIIFAYVEKFF